MNALTRTEFLRGRFKAAPAPLRPPWAIEEQAFSQVCGPCDGCRKICPEGIIVKGSGGYPEISFRHGVCSFCQECVKACAVGALRLFDAHGQSMEGAPWSAKARISGNCLSMLGTVCRTCGELCEAGAISFRLAVGGIAQAIVDNDLCNGCGACVASCPVGAIEVSRDLATTERGFSG
jgi:ferredoxin-type protein NapF